MYCIGCKHSISVLQQYPLQARPFRRLFHRRFFVEFQLVAHLIFFRVLFVFAPENTKKVMTIYIKGNNPLCYLSQLSYFNNYVAERSETENTHHRVQLHSGTKGC